jgi:ribonucleoside-diphosphate reductase alpha chain
MAIAPTATIANITGVVNCIEPIFKNIYMKENLSGNFLVVNKYLIDELEKLGLWNKDILTKIKLDNGSIANIPEIPHWVKRRFKEAFEIDARWVVDAAARRSKWIDQSASTNIFVSASSGKAISDLYMLVWESGVKTTYYLRTLAASQVTKAIAAEAPLLAEEMKVVETVAVAVPNALMLAAEEARKAGKLTQSTLSQEEKYNVCESCQ